MTYSTFSWKALLVTAALTLPTLAFAADPATTKDGILVDHNGMTLYTFKKDTAGKSVCNGKCATAWPPLMADADAMTEGDYSVITRDDGSKQWAYKGMPLYGWFKDTKPGDTTGHGFKGIWDVARP